MATKKKLTTKDLKKVSGGAAKATAKAGPAKISSGRTSAAAKGANPLGTKR